MEPLSAVDSRSEASDSGWVHGGDEPRSAADLAGQLRHAFVAGELTAHFQPQYDLKTGRVVAVEALCRWLHPEEGLLLPGQFIDIAEQYGLIADIGRFMLEESGRRVADWHSRGVRVGLSLNVSPSELVPEFAASVLRRLAELDLPRFAMTLEIVESPEITYERDEIATLEALIDGGVGVSVEDFGTGPTSLVLVRRLPLTEVKIDKGLVHDSSDGVDTLVRECMTIALEREICVVAEGIETREHFDRAVAWGCDRAQGYYVSPPLPVDEVEPLLQRALAQD